MKSEDAERSRGSSWGWESFFSFSSSRDNNTGRNQAQSEDRSPSQTFKQQRRNSAPPELGKKGVAESLPPKVAVLIGAETADQKARKFITAELEKAKGEPAELRKTVFKNLQREYHPDKNPEDPVAAKEVFQFLMDQRAEFLGNP